MSYGGSGWCSIKSLMTAFASIHSVFISRRTSLCFTSSRNTRVLRLVPCACPGGNSGIGPRVAMHRNARSAAVAPGGVLGGKLLHVQTERFGDLGDDGIVKRVRIVFVMGKGEAEHRESAKVPLSQEPLGRVGVFGAGDDLRLLLTNGHDVG